MQKFAPALKYYQAGDYKRVIDALQPMAERGTLTDVTMMMLAQSFYKSGDLAQAASRYAAVGGMVGPKHLDFLKIAFGLFKKLDRIEEGMAVAAKILWSDPHHREAAMFYRHHLLQILSIAELAEFNRLSLARLREGDAFAASTDLPLNHITWCADESINQRITAMQTGTPYDPARRQDRRTWRRPRSGRVRVGYLSNDFFDTHATTMLLRGVLDHHDAEKFDIRLFCHTPPAYKAADKTFRNRAGFIEINDLSDSDAAELIRSHTLDILVDLKGHTDHARIDLVNSGLAPVQVAWLGFPGSANGIDCDYIISDPVVTPDASAAFYHEKFCRLPETYQPNDHVHRALPPAIARSDAGLPDGAVVFAAFNAIRKISPETFFTWVAVLKSVEGSILWMMCDSPLARQNFLAAMSDAGVAADRIVFAGHADHGTHLARLQAADIGLDTYPYNGHTTTSDQLWVGLPVVTKKGTHFASRVSESLLRAIGAPELVAEDEDHYIRLCIDLARDTAKLAAIRRKIIANRFSAPLFDTERFTRHLETGYERMIERSDSGAEPDHIDVPALPPRLASFRLAPATLVA